MQAELPIPTGRVAETRVWVVVALEGQRVVGRWYDTGRKSTLALHRFARCCRFIRQHDTVGGGELNAAAA